MFPFPSEPYEARSFTSERIFGETLKKLSLDNLHPPEIDGKNAYLWSEGNLDEPSYRALNSTRYLSLKE
jgi:hypothetical protein